MKKYKCLILCSFLCFSLFSAGQNNMKKNRVIILTDIENEPDDTESMVRLLLYSNQIDIKGLIATTSTHLRNRVAPESIIKIIDAYGKVRDNLLKHESGFPEPNDLRRIVKQGLPVYGMQGVGKDKDSDGSEWIIKTLEENDDRPLWISVWGGANTLAQALYKIQHTKSDKDVKRLIGKLRVYTISDQDDTGIWMRKNFPDLFYIVSPGGYGNGTWTGMNAVAPQADNELVSNRWLAQNIQQGHGALGACYPDVAYGMEGDTPSWLMLIPNGLNSPEHPDWGGWGGRYEFYKPKYETLDLKGFNGGVPIEEEPHSIWTNATDTYYPYVCNKYGRSLRRDTVASTGFIVTVWRWRTEVQNDFAARMDWCVKPYEEANHAPIPALAHSDCLTVKSGQSFWLDASGTTDPDGDSMTYLWFNYPEAGSYKKTVNIEGSENIYRVRVVAPKVKTKETLHFILKVTDKGTPPLSRYKRVIVTIVP